MRRRIHFSTPVRKNRTKAVRNFLVDYCSNTTIHGVRYFTEQRRHWTERCWWIIAITLAVCFCGTSIQNVWLKWRNNPVTINMNEKLLPIPTIPFPTVTICPEIKTFKDKLDFTSLFGLERDEWDLPEVEMARMKGLAHLCVDVYELFEEDNCENFVNVTVFDVIEDMAPALKDSLFLCEWAYGGNNCTELFAPILTDDGLCFSFNILNSQDIYTENMAPEMMNVFDQPNITDWDPENGYNDIADEQSYPIHVYSARDGGLLKFNLKSNDEDIEYICRTLTPGFKVFINSPGTILKSSDAHVRVGFSESVQISFNPKLTTTSDGLRKYTPDQRQCFFTSERQLRFFKIYTQENCHTECLANYTQLQCGCVKFSMPRNESTKICGPSKIHCYRRAYQTLFEEDIIDGLSNEEAREFRSNCDCLPACRTITYDAEIDRTKFDWQGALRRTLNYSLEEVSKVHVSTVSIYFQNFQIGSLRREEQYTITDFLAICGGLLGLCLGVSALSIIECFYYSTLRLFWSFRKKKSENSVVPFKSTRINHISIDMPYLQ